MRAKIAVRTLPPGRRILAISDIHGNLPYFQGLLKKCVFCPDDILILVGDIMEKGPDSLGVLRAVMALSETHTVWPVCGNCDGWHRHLLSEAPFAIDFRDYIRRGRRGWQPGLLRQMCDEIGWLPGPDTPPRDIYDRLAVHFQAEFDFMDSFPDVIRTEHYDFVHGGLPEGPPETWDGWACTKNDAFLRQGRRFDRWVIVGHWPVMLYGDDITCANPIIDRDSHIISIDGGCVLKDDGQLNALIIPQAGSEAFSFLAWDPFPVRRVRRSQCASHPSAYIRWGDNQVEVLERGAEFSRCRHVRTGYTLDILTKYLYGEGRFCTCNDCTDYELPLEPGDLVSVVEETSRGYLVKHTGISGWYRGELE